MKKSMRIYWLTFARFVLNRRQLTVTEVNKALHEKGGPTPYWNLPELVTSLAYNGDSDGKEIYDACIKNRVTAQRASEIAVSAG